MADAVRFEIVKGFGPEERFVELWDKSLAPAGLAFEAFEAADGTISVVGYHVAAPINEIERFVSEAKSYLGI